jgi:hypothetical protein
MLGRSSSKGLGKIFSGGRSMTRADSATSFQSTARSNLGDPQPSRQPPVDRNQEVVKSNLNKLQAELLNMERVFQAWQNTEPCGFFIRKQGPSDVFIGRLNQFMRVVQSVYAGRQRITVFDYDSFTHSITSRSMKLLSLMYSALSFYTSDKGMGAKVQSLVKKLHSLYVLATCDDYFGKEVRMYVAARESGDSMRVGAAKATIANLLKSPMVRTVGSTFIDSTAIKRFSN